MGKGHIAKRLALDCEIQALGPYAPCPMPFYKNYKIIQLRKYIGEN